MKDPAGVVIMGKCETGTASTYEKKDSSVVFT